MFTISRDPPKSHTMMASGLKSMILLAASIWLQMRLLEPSSLDVVA